MSDIEIIVNRDYENYKTNYKLFCTMGCMVGYPVPYGIYPSNQEFIYIKKKRHNFYKRPKIQYCPDITIIIPVYNSKDTLFQCIESIQNSTYPNEHMKILLIDNKGSQEDFQVYAKAQEAFPNLNMHWMESKQGKSKALNMALYNSEGKYIMNVDSDGFFDKNAIMNMIEKFEQDPEICCMTGAILTNSVEIEEKYKKFFPRMLRKLEFMEYAQAFLAGRSYSAESNAIYTLSGAFSAFRKSSVLQSQMYNTDTICEDTQMTFQMKYLYHLKVDICEDAIFYVDPIEGINKLYTQRQRWQRGSLEVSKMFADKFSISKMFTDVNVRTVLYDHTFAFPRIIWYIITFYFIIINYSRDILLFTTGLIYLLYIVIGYFYYFNATCYLKNIEISNIYYKKNFHYVIILPLFNFLIFFFRFIGIINSIGTDSSWKTNNFNDEFKNIKGVVKSDFTLWKRKKKGNKK